MYKYLPVLLVLVFLLVSCGGDGNGDSGPTLPPQAAAGQRTFRVQCATCHAVEGDRVIVGPSLHGIATRAADRVEGLTAEEYLHESIVAPNAHIVDGFVEGAMPQNFARDLSSEQVDQLVAYLMTLD